MSINQCTINQQTINAACNRIALLSIQNLTFEFTVDAGTPLNAISTMFMGGPVQQINLISGGLNDPLNGTATIVSTAGMMGNIILTGLSTNVIGQYVAVFQIVGAFNTVQHTIILNVTQPVVRGGGGSLVSPNVNPSVFQNRPWDNVDVFGSEGPDVHVEVVFQNQDFHQTLSRTDGLEHAMIMVTDLACCSTGQEFTINIDAIEIRKITRNEE